MYWECTISLKNQLSKLETILTKKKKLISKLNYKKNLKFLSPRFNFWDQKTLIRLEFARVPNNF